MFCGQSSKALSDCARRMSIFGVPLKGHLDGQHRKVPLILEKCVDELQRRGLKVKVSILLSIFKHRFHRSMPTVVVCCRSANVDKICNVHHVN